MKHRSRSSQPFFESAIVLLGTFGAAPLSPVIVGRSNYGFQAIQMSRRLVAGLEVGSRGFAPIIAVLPACNPRKCRHASGCRRFLRSPLTSGRASYGIGLPA